jgi:hypothetical protein
MGFEVLAGEQNAEVVGDATVWGAIVENAIED